MQVIALPMTTSFILDRFFMSTAFSNKTPNLYFLLQATLSQLFSPDYLKQAGGAVWTKPFTSLPRQEQSQRQTRENDFRI